MLAELDPLIVCELESGTRTWTLADIEAYAGVLGISLSTLFSTWDNTARS